MKRLDFKPAKSGGMFRKNYKLHDVAELTGKNLLVQWNIKFMPFGQDRRYEKLWEGGEDKPDLKITWNGKAALLDWKGKRYSRFRINQRAVKSYEHWMEKLNIPVVICFFTINVDSHGAISVINRRFAEIGLHKYEVIKNKEWDKNSTVEFKEELPIFNKKNLINLVFNRQSNREKGTAV